MCACATQLEFRYLSQAIGDDTYANTVSEPLLLLKHTDWLLFSSLFYIVMLTRPSGVDTLDGSGLACST